MDNVTVQLVIERFAPVVRCRTSRSTSPLLG